MVITTLHTINACPSCPLVATISLQYSTLEDDNFEWGKAMGEKISDQFRFRGNCSPTPPLSHHFALREK